MRIVVANWMCGRVSFTLDGTKYQSEDPKIGSVALEGDLDVAFSIMKVLFDSGWNVQLRRVKPRNLGTKKNPDWTKEELLIFTDDKGFTQR